MALVLGPGLICYLPPRFVGPSIYAFESSEGEKHK